MRIKNMSMYQKCSSAFLGCGCRNPVLGSALSGAFLKHLGVLSFLSLHGVRDIEVFRA